MAEATETDIFQEQQSTIRLLQDVIREGQQPQQIIYASPAQPTGGKPTNYLLWAGVSIVIFWLFSKIKG